MDDCFSHRPARNMLGLRELAEAQGANAGLHGRLLAHLGFFRGWLKDLSEVFTLVGPDMNPRNLALILTLLSQIPVPPDNEALDAVPWIVLDISSMDPTGEN